MFKLTLIHNIRGIQFLNKYMPNLENYFHYRSIDVSTIKELVLRWYPEIKQFKKKKIIMH